MRNGVPPGSVRRSDTRAPATGLPVVASVTIPLIAPVLAGACCSARMLVTEAEVEVARHEHSNNVAGRSTRGLVGDLMARCPPSTQGVRLTAEHTKGQQGHRYSTRSDKDHGDAGGWSSVIASAPTLTATITAMTWEGTAVVFVRCDRHR